jgi:hypothetical protein
VSIIEETRDLDVLRAEEVIAFVKVYDKREDLHDERDKLTGTEKAFSSLRLETIKPTVHTRVSKADLLKNGNHRTRGDQIGLQTET